MTILFKSHLNRVYLPFSHLALEFPSLILLVVDSIGGHRTISHEFLLARLMLVSPTILSTITHIGKCSPPQISHIQLLKKPGTTVTRPLASFTSMHYNVCSYQSSHWNVAGDTVLLGYRIFKRDDNVQWSWTVSPEGTSVLMGVYRPVYEPLLSLLAFLYLLKATWLAAAHLLPLGPCQKPRSHHSLLTMPNYFKPLDRSSLPWYKVSWNYVLNKPFLPWVAFVFYHNYKKKQAKPTKTDGFWL